MGLQVCQGALLTCGCGVSPSPLVVIRPNILSGLPAANVLDHKPFLNIQSFGLCNSIVNPTVAAATAAALGVLTPMPCVPMTTAPWLPGKLKVLLGGAPTLDQQSKLMCLWGGVISIVVPGQFKHLL